MRFGSVCSGIEAASVAWAPLGWKAAWLAEIEKFPAAVLAHHYPEVPNLGDMTALPARIAAGEVEAPDIFCGGTPCQAFSVAGLRESLDDARGNLSLVFCEIANAIDTARSVCGHAPAVIFYENVPGILSTKDNAFGCFLAGLAGEDDPLVPPGRKWTNAGCVSGPQRTVAWRVLDAQYFGVAQRRRRVFVVASARKGFDPAQVLFEWDGVRRDTAPSREAGQVAPTIPARSTAGGGLGTDFDLDGGVITMAHDQGQCVAFDTTQITSAANYSSPKAGDHCHPLAAGAHAPAIAFPANLSGTQCASAVDVAPSMGAANPTAVAFNFHKSGNAASSLGVSVERVDCLRAFEKSPMAVQPAAGMQVRRLTPTEAERLQGFPDNYTAIPWRKKPADQCPDGPRYKALGNSWAVPNVRWIGERIQRHLAGEL